MLTTAEPAEFWFGRLAVGAAELFAPVSLASTVRPPKELPWRCDVSVGSELMGALSGMLR